MRGAVWPVDKQKKDRKKLDSGLSALYTVPMMTNDTAARYTVDRNARKGKSPSDHAPVLVDLTD